MSKLGKFIYDFINMWCPLIGAASMILTFISYALGYDRAAHTFTLVMASGFLILLILGDIGD